MKDRVVREIRDIVETVHLRERYESYSCTRKRVFLKMMEMNTADPRIGTVLNGRYKIIERIAAGGMAVVYRGERVELGRPVAVKFLQELMLQYPALTGRFEAEAKAMSRLSHPYCVSVIDFGVDGAPYIVMDYLEGRTLKAVLSSERITPNRALTIARQILAGISHAHSQGIVHRDIKPENIMLQDAVGVGETVRIFDFGLAKPTDADAAQSVSMSSLVAGTPNYMSPEQSRGKKVDERTDLYSICVVLFELLCGQRPFVHDDFIEVVRMHREAEPPTLNEKAGPGTFSEELENVLKKGLSKSPEDRHQTAEELAAALDKTPEGLCSKESEMSVADPRGKTLPIGISSPFFEATLEKASQSQVSSPDGDSKKRDFRKFRRSVAAAALGAGILSAIVFWGGRDAPSEGASEAVSEQSPKKQSPVAVDDKKDALEPKKAKAAESSEAPVAPPKKPEVKTVKDALSLIKAGDKETAIAGLQKLRRAQPKNAQIVFLMGRLYFEKVWWADALDHYAEAIRLNPAYKKRHALQRDVITALGSDKTSRKASYVLKKVIGKPALPMLRRAAKKDDSPVIRKRAKALIKKIK